MFDFRYEKSQDIAGIRKVHQSAFETQAEADLVDALRDKKEFFRFYKKTERSLRLVGVVAPTPRRATSTNIQFAIFNFQSRLVRVG